MTSIISSAVYSSRVSSGRQRLARPAGEAFQPAAIAARPTAARSPAAPATLLTRGGVLGVLSFHYRRPITDLAGLLDLPDLVARQSGEALLRLDGTASRPG
jgi:hypothetical protein